MLLQFPLRAELPPPTEKAARRPPFVWFARGRPPVLLEHLE